MDRACAQSTVVGLLDQIQGHRWRDLHVPHGFEVADVVSEQMDNPFVPRALSHWRVAVKLRLPILYSPDSSWPTLRAALPAVLDNLESLRAWLVAEALGATPRVELREWEVTPDQAPPPYLDDGRPNGPPAYWTVDAVMDVR